MRVFLQILFVTLLLPFSALAQGDLVEPVHKWRMATSWPGGGLFEQAQNWATRVEELTNGRIEIQVFPGGALGNALKVTETVKNGVAEAGHTWPNYDWGKDKATVLFGGWPGGMDGEQTLHWLFERDGQALLQEYMKEKFGVVAFPAGVSTAEIFLHSKKPVRTLEDLKGLKIRTTGAWLELTKELGAAPVTSSGAEVYQMLERGNIDATEWATPGVNLPMGFHDIAPYIILPGLHQPTEVVDVVINEKAWDKLSAHDQKMVELASKLTSYEYWTKSGADDIDALEVYQSSGNEIIILDDSVKTQVYDLAQNWADKEAEQNPWFSKILKSQRKFVSLWEKHKSARDLR